MIKGKKAGKTTDEMGKRWYDFNFKSEKIIYYYLCCKQIKKKEMRNLNDDLKFEEYCQWKHYICNRYQNYSKEKLIEFSRYLNLMIRNIKPSHEYWTIMATAYISMVFTMVINIAMGKHMDLNNNSAWIIILVTILLEALFIISLIILIVKIMHPIYDNHSEESFLRDYKEIIDDIIEKK